MSKALWFSPRLALYKKAGLHSFSRVGTSFVRLTTAAAGLRGVQQDQHLSRNTFAHTGERWQLEPEQRQEHLPAVLAVPPTFGRYTQVASVGLIETTTKLWSQQPQHNI